MPNSPYISYATYRDPSLVSRPTEDLVRAIGVQRQADIHISDSTLLEIIGSHSIQTPRYRLDQSPYSVQLVDGVQNVNADTAGVRLSGRPSTDSTGPRRVLVSG